MFVESTYPNLVGKVCFASVSEKIVDAISELAPSVLGALRKDYATHSKLNKMGSSHGGRPEQYLAAHVVMHDTSAHDLLEYSQSVEPVATGTLISFGGRPERIFHAARTLCNDQVQVARINTAQFLTRHGTPPYYRAMGGEPSLEEVMKHGFDIKTVTDTSALKDFKHFVRFESGVAL